MLFDTSAALAFVDDENPCHLQVRGLAADAPHGLAGHANFEFFSVLTRLPLPKRLGAADALRLITTEFPEPRFLAEKTYAALLSEFELAGVVGGMVYDGLVGVAARAATLPLLTCDKRAEETYRLLKVTYVLAT